jgi:hypothetical protein
VPCDRRSRNLLLGARLIDEEVYHEQETPKDDPRQRTDQGSSKQTDKPWKGNPEKEQRSHVSKDDLEKWQRSSTH